MKILLILMLLPSLLLAQATKKMVVKDERTPYREVYEVLKKDKKVRHGAYQKFRNPEVLVMRGYYKSGKKDSLWLQYQYDGKTKQAEGHYADDERSGVWTFYDHLGEIEQQYNFTSNELVYYKPNDASQKYRVFKGNDTLLTKIDRPPLYIGGSVLQFEERSYQMSYPPLAREKGIEGKVYIIFTIDSTGKASNHKVIQGIGGGCDQEALKAAKSLPNHWLPAILNGQAVTVEHTLPFGFTLR